MKKSRIDAYKLVARNDHTSSSEEDVIEPDNPLEPNNTIVDDKDKQFFQMELETDVIIENLTTFTIYNWQSVNATDSLEFSATSHMWNSIRHADDNGESSPFHCHLLQINLDLGHLQVGINLINNIDNKTIILW